MMVRFTLLALGENWVCIYDLKGGRTARVYFERERGEMRCALCSSSECPHAGYAWGVLDRYRKRKPSTLILFIPDTLHDGGESIQP
ncbi:hypothetical protein B9Q03_14155 [Candidatus Marsarchaeota G2 archaeon OSP_D]|jgi:hypothetical protein|uniref:Uncharacterized protein n=1 Tax=Candidatus Marsarchaeota G2 archaeon OSP_D TaxID=1978157 RepID=A0A2R6A7W8_9ARCH|nr:MAG: hypothetical protein B9Q03_14155 [Candidatus Marsarchaeota G2 archaeon OSP_D]